MSGNVGVIIILAAVICVVLYILINWFGRGRR
jgi:hypothetical protein